MKKKSVLKIIPLGGVGEIGKNMTVIEYGDNIVVIDCGLCFPREDMLGVDYVIPNTQYLDENKDKLKAFLITHGHEDHIGAIPFLLQNVNIPFIYAPNQAIGLIKKKLDERNIQFKNLFTYNEKSIIKFKNG